MVLDQKVGFLGAGKMATALAGGFVKAGVLEPVHLCAGDPSPQALQQFVLATGGHGFPSNAEVARSASILFIAVKPDQVAPLLREISPEITSSHLVISIAAGIPIAKLEAQLPANTKVIRVMPNTPALVGGSASGFALGTHATATDAASAMTLLGTVGIAVQVKESLLDAVTGLSGSGPAYAFMIIEALADGGVAAGLPREIAIKLAAQTLFGSAKMVLETGMHPGVLKDMVTSPGGTTIEGLHELEKGGLRAALISAVRAASEKSRKLGLA